MMVSTTNDIPGHRITGHIRVVRGITVRSRSIVGNVGGVQALFGGRIGAYVGLAETARQEAFVQMCDQAAAEGADAIVGMRYDATEVLAYGTAVQVAPE